MVGFPIVARPLYFVREHTIHVRNHLYWHINEALAKYEADMRLGIGSQDRLECIVQRWVGRRL